ncbi:alpha-ketoacid dehydrogenase subunit alpha/beta [Lewinella cohaerens]|uniref:alpha-ketoacid dehydrogenase subunit alpha/beta n=1 Tax=Lewinella cohaerens TaxID=70995 RepID=UPI00035F1973|nr:alpha-ketoacid dehydrogenase subunit alpha/beta [Lewinella cohaerens]
MFKPDLAALAENKLRLTADLSKEEILNDFSICCISREVSLLARREVLTGKAKFGISGDGKEVPQVAMARAFRKGDFRSGYYRDQTFMFAMGLLDIEAFFSQLYADTDNDPFSGGRQMNAHFATPTIDKEGNWYDTTTLYNVSADIAPTAGQMARALGLALASKKYRSNEALQENKFSKTGQEVSFCTIGDASTSEGVFWETLNAAAVQQVPLAVFVWDDGYGISVPKELQTAKGSISTAVSGLATEQDKTGFAIHNLQGWNYAHLVDQIQLGIEQVRERHEPALFHIEELTQPQGHSTSGSHERYKTKERLSWEKEYDCILQMEKWITAEGIAEKEEISDIRKQAKKIAKAGRDAAWKAFNIPARNYTNQLQNWYQQLPADDTTIQALLQGLQLHTHPQVHEVCSNARRLTFHLRRTNHPLYTEIKAWLDPIEKKYHHKYSQHLHSEGNDSALRVPAISPRFSPDSPSRNGYQILNAFFDYALEKYPELYAFGEDVGQIGGVNQSFSKLQEKYGQERVFDTGIREWTIMGQAIGMAMRGLRPIAEIQYLDYLLYGLEPLSDDLATLRWRSNGIQKAPAIIRTRGHRLEGIWHSGSPMGMIINALRGIYVCTPRNMVQAAGMYNTLLQSGEPGLVIECLNGYRRKERMPENIGEYTVPLGVPETLLEGDDLTLLTYGSCVRLAIEACELLAKDGIRAELVDIQTLLPFDLEHRIIASLKKTNRLLIVDEDVPGGASAYILQKIVEEQNGYCYLDAAPQTLSAKAHRPAYGSDGDYFSKPGVEDIYEAAFAIVEEAEPGRF